MKYKIAALEETSMKKAVLNRLATTLFIVSVIAGAKAWSAPKPPGKVDAPQGGTFTVSFASEPATLNPYTRSDVASGEVLMYVFEGLMSQDIDTLEYVPALAESMDEAKDGKSITFKLRKDAVFSDGKPVTPEDVKFSFESMMNPDFKAVMRRTFYENIGSVEILDAQTVKFHIKNKYFLNKSTAATMEILPKHFYGDHKKKVNKVALGSGPYLIEKYDQGKAVTLKKNPKWWGSNVAYYKGQFNFDKIVIKFISDDSASLESFKRGDLDFIRLKSEQYVQKTTGSPWGEKVFKEQAKNSSPKGTNFMGLNMKNDLFKDRDVRLALTYLYDRVTLSKKFYFDLAVPATGPWFFQSKDANPNTKAIPFDVKKGRELLTKAGWADSDKDGVLDKMIDGKKRNFKFTMLLPNKDAEKYFTFYKEELKKSGIDMKISLLEWNAFVKKLDEKGFDAVAMSWGGVVEGDPKQIWHSASSATGGSNFVSYSNSKVDALIEKGREELDEKKRTKMFQEVYDLVANDVPYVFMVNPLYDLYAYSNKIQRVRPTYKYSIARETWYAKP
jgi:microcin C transport system substrate-binding protein